MMFRVVTTIKYELCYAAINPAIGVILNGLIQLYRSSPNPYIRTTLLELVISIPARWLALTPHMPLLLPYITLALHSATDLPSLAIRTLEYWLDSSNPHDFCTVIQKIPNAAQELIVGLNIHLRPQPHPYGTAALKLLGYTCSL
jgi:transformation/transcription domain-associated protein